MHFPRLLIPCFILAIAAPALASEPVVVAEAAPSAPPQQPQVAIDAGGTIHVVFGAKTSKTEGDVYYACSSDGGQSFSSPVRVATIAGLALGMRRGPRVAVSGEAICIAAIGHTDGNIFSFRSADQGKTWQQAATINDRPHSAGEGLHALAAGPNGELACVWLDHRNQDSELFAATSTDGGKTWSPNVLAYRSPDGDVCPCCHPSVTYSSDGSLHILWRNDVGGSRDMYHAASSDGGKTFGKAQKLGAGTWPLDRCPMDGGSIAILTSGKPATVWRRDKTIYYFAAGDSHETEFGPGEQPWLAATSRGPVAVWVRKRGGSLLVRMPGAKSAIELSQTATDPVVASGGSKKEVVVAWEEGSGADRRIVCRRL